MLLFFKCTYIYILVTLKCFKEKVYDVVSKSLTSAYVSLVSHERSQHASKVTHDNMLERLTSMYVALGRGTPRVYESDLGTVLFLLQIDAIFP